MSVKNKLVAQNPLILRCHRLMEAFAKSDDERDFYLNRQEGFLVYVDLDKSQEELDELTNELTTNSESFCQIPKLTFYEVKKVMEGFVNEKVYDIDTKEKLLDIIQSKEARENFLEFIYDHHTELEKWQQYYQERFRVRIIEWLRNNQFDFVFEEDLELTKSMCEKLKLNLFVPKVSKDLLAQRKNLIAKAKTYYSNEALNPRPKRGRPPKQVAKIETEPQFSHDVFISIPKAVKPFLFAPDYHGSSAIFTFSGKFASEADLLAHRRQQMSGGANFDLQSINQKLQALRTLSTGWTSQEGGSPRKTTGLDGKEKGVNDFASVSLEGFSEEEVVSPRTKSKAKKELPVKKAAPTKISKEEKQKGEEKTASKKAETKVKPKKEKARPAKKAVPKARLRPLPRKAQGLEEKKEKGKAKGKSTSLRHLRPAKKR